jgi:hypothetical protein
MLHIQPHDGRSRSEIQIGPLGCLMEIRKVGRWLSWFRTSRPVSCDETALLRRYTSIRQYGLYCEYNRFIPWKIAAVDPVGDPWFSDVGESVMAKTACQRGLGEARTTQQMSKKLRELISS